jgi:hypothetical protein
MELREMNGLDCNILYVGMRLVLPESTVTKESTDATDTAAE